MEEVEAPLNDLLKTLEVSLTSLLEKVRPDPWSLLIFQTLIWSFRRWAIHYLISTETVGSMHNYLWESHIDLVQQHAPKGLQEFGVVWLSPSNVGDRTDSLEELNSYFMFIVDKLNHSIETDDEDEQNLLSIFLDETITDIITEWLDNLSDYRIYPGYEDDADNFSTEKIFTIMQKILEKTTIPKVSVKIPEVKEAPSNLPDLHEPVVTAPVEIQIEVPIEIQIEPPVEAPVEAPVPTPPVQETVACICPHCSSLIALPKNGDPVMCSCENSLRFEVPVQETVASALQRRRTLKNRGSHTSTSMTRNRRKFPRKI